MSHHLIGTGRIGKDTVLRRAGEWDVCDVAIAFSYGKKDADNHKPTQWVKAVMWGKYAKAMAQYLVKGTVVYVVLEEVHIATFTKTDGTTATSLEGKVVTIDIVSSPPKPARAPAPAPRPQGSGFADMRQGGGSGFDDMDSDIPY